MLRLLLLNGPPHSGKDFAGNLIERAVDNGPSDAIASVVKFAGIVKERCHAAYGLYEDGIPFPANHFEALKDTPLEEFYGRTPRECYIAFSEMFWKPLHGKAIFGRVLLGELYARLGVSDRDGDLVVVTDSGFTEEAEVLVAHFGAENCALVRLHREGCSFAGDSRGYIDLAHIGVPARDVVNPGTEEGLRRALAAALPELSDSLKAEAA